jgi:hypothetical protein
MKKHFKGYKAETIAHLYLTFMIISRHVMLSFKMDLKQYWGLILEQSDKYLKHLDLACICENS